MEEYLPLPPPWTIEMVSEYIDELVEFINEYENIAKFNSRDVFMKGLPVSWVLEYNLERWIAIISGENTENLPEELAKFLHLSRNLPLVDNRTSFKGSARTNRKGMTPKKDHEVDAMVAFVAEMRMAHDISAKS